MFSTISNSKKLIFLTPKILLSIATCALLTAPTIAGAYYFGDEDSGLAFSSVGKACGGGAGGNFQIFTGAYNQGCNWVGEFDLVSCNGGGSGRITGTVVVVLPQSGCTDPKG